MLSRPRFALLSLVLRTACTYAFPFMVSQHPAKPPEEDPIVFWTEVAISVIFVLGGGVFAGCVSFSHLCGDETVFWLNAGVSG